jgi:hypothetical protein
VLVRARVPNGAASAATLDARSPGGRLLLNAPYAIKDGTPVAAGRFFPLTLGTVQAATLLIGNVSGTDVSVDVHVGKAGAAGGGVFTTPRVVANGIWRVDLTAAEQSSFLVVAASDQIICQVVADEGRILSYLALPA